MNKRFRKNEKVTFRKKIINILMRNGEKKTSEKLILQSVKLLQKSTNKKFKDLFLMALMKSILIFKIKEQILKKGKRKTVRTVPVFVINDYLRLANTLKLFKENIRINNFGIAFYKSFMKEILASAAFKGSVINEKTLFHKQLLNNKQYLSQFRW